MKRKGTRRKKKRLHAGAGIVIGIVLGLLVLSVVIGVFESSNFANIQTWVRAVRGINNFESCIAAGFPAMESYPRKCIAHGKMFVEEIERTDCITDDDCVVFGQDGDCNCGCYKKGSIPVQRVEGCFCAAPTSCRCVENECEINTNDWSTMIVDNQEQSSHLAHLIAGRVGQIKFMLNKNITTLEFYLAKRGLPVGDVNFTIRKASDNSIIQEKNWGDAADLNVTHILWENVTFDTSELLYGEVYVNVEYYGGDDDNFVYVAYSGSDVTSGFLAIYNNKTGDFTDYTSFDVMYRLAFDPSEYTL